MPSKVRTEFLCALIMGLLLLGGLGAWGQAPKDAAGFLRLLHAELNRVRDSVGVAPLAFDATLSRAAMLQVDYCKKYDTLSHYQPNNWKRYDPTMRVLAVGGIHDRISENMLYLSTQDGMTPQALAQQMVRLWVHSPGHWANLRNPLSTLAGLGVGYDAGTGRLYACQVFAQGLWQPPKSLRIHPRAWGIRPAGKGDCAGMMGMAGKKREFTYGYFSVGNTVSFHHDDKRLVEALLRPKKGAMAGDVVLRDQFPCCSPNTLHGSPFHDGVLLKPRLWKWMLKYAVKDSARPLEFRVTTNRGIPELPAGNFHINPVFVQNKRFCGMVTPISLEAGQVPTRYIEFPPDTIPLRPADHVERTRLSFRVPFAKGETEPAAQDLVPIYDSLRANAAEVAYCRIKGYASVEGGLEINAPLFQKRAENLRMAIQAKQIGTFKMEQSSTENWTAFSRDIRGTTFAWLGKRSQEQVRDTLAHDAALRKAMEPILAKHRYVDIEIEVRSLLPPRTIGTEELADSLHRAILAKKQPLAHRLQSELVRRYIAGEGTESYLLDDTIPFEAEWLPLLHNQTWIGDKAFRPVGYANYDPVRRLSQKYPWFHLRHLEMSILAFIDGYSKKGSAPSALRKDIDAQAKLGLDTTMLASLNYNYYLGLVVYNGRNNKPVHEDFMKFAELYAGKEMTLEEAIELGRFLNANKGSAETISLLRPFKESAREDIAFTFLYAWTAGIHPDLVPEEEWMDWMLHAQVLAPEKWQTWVSRDWELLRHAPIKERYCNCNAGK